MQISKTVLASFNAIEVSIEVHTDKNHYAPDDFTVVLRAMRDDELFNYDELVTDTLEEANESAARNAARLMVDNLYEFTNGTSRDWLI